MAICTQTTLSSCILQIPSRHPIQCKCYVIIALLYGLGTERSPYMVSTHPITTGIRTYTLATVQHFFKYSFHSVGCIQMRNLSGEANHTHLGFLVAGSRAQQHEGHILDIAHWHFFYWLPGQSDRTTPPVCCWKCYSQRRRSRCSGRRV